MSLNVLLVGSSNRGLNHLFRWLESTLLSACTCENPSLWLREYCPDVGSLTDGLARADDVALVGPVQWESPPLEDAGCFVRRASFVLASGKPCLFREPVSLNTTVSTYASWITIAKEAVPGDAATLKELAPLTVWNSTNCCASTTLTPPAFGATAPYITITSPLEIDANGYAKYIPDLRVVGLLNPMDVTPTSFGEMFVQGAFVLTGIQSGMEIQIDVASANIKMRQPHSDATWYDGSRLLAIQSLTSTAPTYARVPSFNGANANFKRWFSFENCDEAVVVVEPNYFYDSTDGVNYASTWTVTLGQHDRFGCV